VERPRPEVRAVLLSLTPENFLTMTTEEFAAAVEKLCVRAFLA
jgi:hypothetical protein